MKRYLLSVLLVFSVLVSGCRGEEASSPTTQENTVAPTYGNESYTASSDQEQETYRVFEFALPEGFEIHNQSEKSCDLVYAGQHVGGFVITDLDAGMVKDPDKETIKEYLNSYVEPPLVFDCMMSSTGEEPKMLEVSLIVVDLESEETHEYKHYLFEKDSACYDMWLDTKLVNGEVRVQLLQTMGLDDGVVYLGNAAVSAS